MGKKEKADSSKIGIRKSKRNLSKASLPDPDVEEDPTPPKKRKANNESKPLSNGRKGSLIHNKKLQNSKKGKKTTKNTNEQIDSNTQTKSVAVERCVVKKGKIPVDGLCPIASTSHVFCDEDIWDCMLNQTNIQFNNNKYYLIQLLKDDSKDAYSVWMRWGRVGCNGQNSLQPCSSNLEKAKNVFMKKFSDKTKNSWEVRHSFEKVPGKYDLLKMDYEAKDEVDSKVPKVETPNEPPKKVESKLVTLVKALIELICDVRAMEEAVIEMKYDAKKAPLGKLTADQVKAGYLALKHIDDIISGSGKCSNRDLLQACNDFYTRIPHYFGMKVPPIIRTRTDVHEKMNLLQSLSDIQAAMTILGKPQDHSLHPADQHYNDLQCDINPLSPNGEEYKVLEKYLMTTHGKTHSFYKMELLNIFKVKKSGEEERFLDYGNRMLLWHGSRITNWAGILGRGLMIAPPEAPSTGYMFGKGIYFADMSSKSANYCMATSRNNIGLLVLCDVSLGKPRELIDADYNAHKLTAGFHSVKGLGKIAPDPKNYVTREDCIIPIGPGKNTNVNNAKGYTLQYNEYIVYDITQIKIKYLFKIKFKY